MKKLIVIAGLAAAVAAGTYVPANAVPLFDPWASCKALGKTEAECHGDGRNELEPNQQDLGVFGVSGSAASH
ncbi:hypothetical protein [Nocardia jejuensis]|uniref:hypothetical protein n=1 Tax=Nocardia jejuensis TaxID=328049 RepID=UPI00082A9384|nr:hypothetical protein [Nocardia jejuensis]